MRQLIFLLVLIISAGSVAFADDLQQVITLKDGSQIKGVLSGIDNGVYTVKTPIIGDVHVSAADVTSITNANGSPTAVPQPAANTAAAMPTPGNPQPSGGLDQQIASTQQKLMSDPQSMQMIMQMQQNPDVMQALQDPALVRAVQNHDMQAVQNNPAVQKLINDPQMRALAQRLSGQQQQQSQ